MNKIFKHKRGASGLKVVCEFAKSHCSSGEKTAVSSGAHVSTRSGFKSLSIALISALTLGIATPAMAVTFGELGNRGGSTAVGGAVAGGNNAKAQAGGSTAIGVSVTASGGNSTAIGMNAESITGQALAVGSYARARGDQSTAIGNDVTSIGASSIAIGNDDISSVYKDNPLFTAEELAKKDIVDELDKLCAVASCETMYGLKKVGNVYVTMENDIVDNVPKYRKWSPTFTTGAGAIAIGSRTVAMSDGATAIGTLAVAAGKKSAALGSFSKATAENALAFGAESIASGTNSSVFGIGAKASKNNSMAIGTGTVSNMENSVALGVNSKTDYTGSNKKGYMPGNGYMLPMASSAGVISVGSATQPRRIVNLASGALDTDAVNVAQLKSLAENLGVDDIADNTDKTMRYLSVNRLPGSAAAGVQDLIQKEKDFKTYSQYRKYHDIMVLGKNRTGTTDYDNEIHDLETKISQMEGKYTGFQSAIATPAGLATINQNSSEQDVQNVTNSINGYTTTILTAAEKTTIKSHNAANEGATGADAIAIGYDAKSTGAQAVSLGKTATASGTDAIAIGNGAKADGGSSINIGSGVKASLGGNVTLIGNNNGAGENSSVSLSNTSIIGSGNQIDGSSIDRSLIIGSKHEIGQETATTNKLSQNVIVGDKIRLDNSEQAVTIGSDIIAKNSKGGIAIGGDDADLVGGGYPKTEIQGKGAIAIGVSAKAMKDAAMSLGVNSQTTVAQGVALGFNSTADRASIVNKTDAYNGSDTNVANTIKGSYGAVSVGNSDNTRQIINVAAGSADTDAVNVAQLKNNSFNVKVKDGTSSAIKSGKTVEFASDKNYLKIKHTTDNDGSKFTFDIDQNALKTAIGATSGGNYSLDFSGDTGTQITRDQANKKLKIQGGATATNLSTNNIGVEASGDTLNIKLAKALKGLTSAEFSDSVKIGGATISGGTDNSLSFGNAKITNIAAGTDDKDAVNKKQAETIAQDEAKKAIDPTFLKDKIIAGTNIAGIEVDNTSGSDKLKINAKGATVEGTTGFVKVTPSSEADNVTKYTVDLDDKIKTKIDNAANASANATSAMQTLNVKAGTNTAALNKTNDTLEFAAGDNLKVELDQANRKVTYKLADNLKFDNISSGEKADAATGKAGADGKVGVNGKDGSGVAIDGKDGTIVAHGENGENGENGKSVVINGKDGTIGAKGADGADGVVINGDEHTIIAKGENGKDGVTINGKDGTIGLPGKDGTSANGVVIKSGDVVNGVDGTNGITRIVYTDKNGDHQVATLDDGIKFVGNNGDKALKLNKQFTIQGADANKDTGTATTVWNKFDAGANIMTKAEADGTENGRLTIALAKALKGLTSAEFKNTAGDTTTVNGDGVSYNKADNLNPDGSAIEPKKTVSIGKDGINAGGKTISNVGEAKNANDAVNMKQMNETIKTAIAKNNANTELKFAGDFGETKAKDGKITIAGGQTDDKKLSDKPNIGVVAKDGELNIKLAKDIEVDSVTAKNKITVGEGANKITIADGKITGITSAVDPNGNLAKTLADIDNDKGKTAAEKATKKKEAIQKVLENVDIGSVATVGDLKNVTNGLDSVVENVTNITKNVTSITNNVNNITNITNMVANSGDKETIDKAAKAIDGYKKDPNDKNKQKAAENAIKANKIKTYNPYETTVKNNTTIVEAIQNMNERGIKFIHVSDSDKVGEGDDVTLVSDDSRANKIGSIGIGMNAASTAENAIATGTKSEASGADSIATGTDSKASGANAIAMGTGAQAIGKNTISIGTGNRVTGINSGAIGDPTTIDNVNGVYSMGNDNFIQGGGKGKDNIKDVARDIFAIGNNIGSDTKKVTDAANYSVILGSKGYSDVEKGVALGFGSNANRGALTDADKALVYNGDDAGVKDTIKNTYGAVSVGNEKNTRQIINVAAGSKDSDAVNVAQLKAATSKIMASTGGVSMSNVTIDPKTGRKVTISDDNRANYAPKVTNTGVNSVAIGANSVANRANTVSVGSAGNERIIANVADGVAPTDAANMRQLQSVANMVGEVKKDAMAGTASAMAIGNLPQATIPGKGMMAIGAGYYKGQTATALGVSKMSENGRWVFKASASYDSQRNVGAAGAVGFHF